MENVKFIMRTTGDLDLSEYFAAIPELKVCCDVDHNAMHTFKNGLIMAGEDPCVHLEDDIVLCNDFMNKISEELNKHPDDVIQFFSMRKDDLTIGSRYIPGYLFCMNQCFYLPAGMSKAILDYMDEWTRYDEHPTGYDYLMADYFKIHKIKYWNVCPNLVDHLPVKSRINPKRSSKRQSFTFARG